VTSLSTWIDVSARRFSTSNRIVSAIALHLLIAVALLFGAQAAFAQTETIVYSFAGGTSDGGYPYSGLLIDSSGNLYGTTTSQGSHGDGTAYKLTLSGSSYTESVLYNFGASGDGNSPWSGLVMDSSGNLYGTTATGGSDGYGTFFELSPGTPWTESNKYSFTGGLTDGENPYDQGSLLKGSSGNFYGATYIGGANSQGSIFEISISGSTVTESLVHSFQQQTGFLFGEYPYSGLVADSSGNFYGTTTLGGTEGDGVVYGICGGSYTVLYNFGSTTGDGVSPYGGVFIDSGGNLYGTTTAGGSNNDGTVYELSPPSGGPCSGTYTRTRLYTFGGSGDGDQPWSGVIMDSSGNLWGTTKYGGADADGTVFELAPSTGTWIEPYLYSFTGNSPDGKYPIGGLIKDSSGNFYGTTYEGGAHGYGTVFKVAPLPKLSFAYVSPTANIAGDFNGDGNPDCAVITSTQVVVYCGNGAGGVLSTYTYTFPHSWAFGNPVSNNASIIVGDFNGDGKTDFALLYSTGVYSFISNGDGTFSEPSASPYYYTFPHSLAFGSPVKSGNTVMVGDFNGDGKTDFALVDSTAVYTFLSDGDGTFSDPISSSPYSYTFPNSWAFGNPPSATYAPIVGDLNADGKTDFALVAGTQVFSFTSNGDGIYDEFDTTSPYYYTFPNSWNFGTPLSSSYTPIAADLNGDGKMDFAVLSSTQVISFVNDGNGTFPTLYTTSPYYVTTPSGWGFGTPPSADYTPIAGDLNGDGKTDFALIGSSQVFTFFSNGDGTYTTPSYYTIPSPWGFGTPPSAIYTTVYARGGILILVSSTNGFTMTSNGDGTYTSYDYSL